LQGKYLNASMFLSLTLDYTDSLNAHETPTILTAVERVIHSETVRICDSVFDEVVQGMIEDRLSEEQMPMNAKEFRKVARKIERESVMRL
jgi:hypothetical protein